MHRPLACLWALLAVLVPATFAQPAPTGHPTGPEALPRPTLRATRTAVPPTLDDLLDEPAWQRADSATGFIQYQPHPGAPASERTVVRLLYDDQALYLGVRCYDAAPEQLTVPSLEQDFSTRDSDLFGLTLDPFHDRRNAFLFAVNPAGALADFQAFNDGRNVNRAWEGIVRVRTRIHPWGWALEMAIPFSTLRFDPTRPVQTWGLNFLRRIRRLNEDAYWAPLARPDRLYKMSQAGTLTDLRGLRPVRNLHLKPYVAGDRTAGTLRPPGHDAYAFDAGADLKYSLTPGLTLDLTLNTDFSQVEVDQEQINLTRFSTFFPEKRDFFLENAGVFTFGDVAERTHRTGSSTSAFTLFHSRRIGLVAGRPVPVLGGGRLSGRAGAYEVGLLNLQTRGTALIDPLSRDTTRVPAENFSVVRLRRDVLGSSDVGVLFINRQGGDHPNRTLGLDANFRLRRHLIVNAYAAATQTPGLDGDASAARVLVGWRDPFWDTALFVKHVGDAFNPEVGFVRRRAMRQAYATLGVHPRPANRHLQELNPYVEASLITGLDGRLETRTLGAGLEAELADGSRAGLALTYTTERLDEGFTLVSGAAFDPGRYGFTDARLHLQTSAAHPLSLGLTLGGGGFFDATRRSARVQLLWRYDAHLSLNVFAEHNRISRAGTDYDADLLGLRARYAFSTRLFTSAFVQYNRATGQLITNLRLNVIHAPLSDVFLVLSERRDAGDGTVFERAVTLKVTRLLAF